MKTIVYIVPALLAATIIQSFARETEIERHLAQADEHWQQFDISAAVAEWQQVLKLDQENAKAGQALSKLDSAFENSDEFLDVVSGLIDRGLPAQAQSALAQWKRPYASRDQQARIMILHGRIALANRRGQEALPFFASAETVATDAQLVQRARLGRGKSLILASDTKREGIMLLKRVIAESKDANIRSDAAWILISAEQLQGRTRIASIKQYLANYPASRVKSEAHSELAALLETDHGIVSIPALEQRLTALAAADDLKRRTAVCRNMQASVSKIADTTVLKWFADELALLPPTRETPVPPREIEALALERMATVSRGTHALEAVRRLQRVSRGLIADNPLDERTQRWRSLEAKGLLMEGQLLLMEGKESDAINALSKASSQYLRLLQQGDRTAGQTLLRIGRLLESRGRSDGAAYHYGLVAAAFRAEKLGAESLWRLAMVYREKLDRPLKAIEILQRYHDLYPPSFRASSTSLDRIRSLGYSDVASFQGAQGLKVDGVLGTRTLEFLKIEEDTFREILDSSGQLSPVRGKMVHKVVFDIAASLSERGRFRESISAYMTFLSMYPGHSLGDDALLAIARLFKENDLFNESVAAYDRLMEDYPKGNLTSHAYIEAAYCYECLGEWESATELYDLYLKKFPRYNRASTASANLAALRKLTRYADLVSERDLPDSKMADALYEMGRILYKDMGNRQKAVQIFQEVAGRFPKTYQSPDAWFSAGACLLHESNFESARDSFTSLIRNHAKSRLADDAQYWIGHTLEYQADALNELNNVRVTLKKRSAAETSRLRHDLTLRRNFWPDAKETSAAWHEPHPDILRSGHIRDKVRDNFLEAIRSYRLVVARYPLGDMAQKALLQIGSIYTDDLKDPDSAIEAYRELLEKYPGSTAAVDAQFAVGHHYLEKGALDKAERTITLFLSSFPNHARASEALLNLAECHRRKKEWINALDSYQSFVNRYPAHAKAGKIKEEIEWVKKYRF